MAEMVRVVVLKPYDVALLIPRGTALLPLGIRAADTARSRPYVETVASDFEKVLAMQQADFANLPLHAKG
jgi:hypothetical protein